MRIAEISAPCRKSGSRNTMVSSDFRPKVEIWPFCACNSSGHNYKKSSFIAELAMGQIPRSTNVFLVVLMFQIFQSSSQPAHWNANCRLCRKLNKMLSYRRETALQGALQFSPKVENWNWEMIFYGHYRSIFNHCDKSTWKSGEFCEKMQNKGYYGVQGHSRSSRSVPIESPYAICY